MGSQNIEVIFLGIADHFEPGGSPFSLGPIDVFGLSRHKIHVIYPADSGCLVFLVGQEVFPELHSGGKFKVRLLNEAGNEVGAGEILVNSTTSPLEESDVANKVVDKRSPVYVHFNTGALIEKPGVYVVELVTDEESRKLGEVQFHYVPTPPFTADQIRAFESNPNSAKEIRMELGCKFCTSKLRTYSAVQRHPESEAQGYIWHQNLDSEFVCSCGKTRLPLRYLKESLHGLLIRNFETPGRSLSFVQRYAHQQIVGILERYQTLLDAEVDEAPFQKFIEENPIMLARFHAKKLYVKPNILGKYQADFAVLDSRNQLLLIELERPSMKLFKKDKHPTASLTHAYGQVQDWLHEYAKHPSAFLEGFDLKTDQVMSVKGVVIAGQSSKESAAALQRHLSMRSYPEIEFLTLSDLPSSVAEISRSMR